MDASPGHGDWLVVEELLDRGDAAFVDELRKLDDADRLGAFAGRWYADRRPSARAFLLDYLERPLNAYRHEALVKRLFKLAEQQGDDRVMSRFLVTLDRSIRRVVRRHNQFRSEIADSATQAEALADSWRAEGLSNVFVKQWVSDRYQASAFWIEQYITMPRGTEMPRGRMVESAQFYWDPFAGQARRTRLPDWAVKLKLKPADLQGARELPAAYRPQLSRFRLFSVATRKYLRRRAWRYFRRLGRQHPERYVSAVAEALRLYEDADVTTGLALIDNWGLMHVLFHFSPVLVARPDGWVVAEGHDLNELAPAPIHNRLWQASPRVLLDLLAQARCRPVRRWAGAMIERDLPGTASAANLEELLGLLAHEDADVAALAAQLLPHAQGLETLAPENWLDLAETCHPAGVEVLSELIDRYVEPRQVTIAGAVRLARLRPLPLARLGLKWLQTKAPQTAEDCQALLTLVDAQAEPVRPELLAWLRGVPTGFPAFLAEWVLEMLDSRHADARAEGLAWFQDDPRVRDDPAVWQRLLESPYDDVRLALVGYLEARFAGRTPAELDALTLDADQLRALWAAVLLNIYRGGRSKPLVVRQLTRRLEARPQDAARLLPLLGVAMRSIRGPEWRAGLAAVIRLAERQADCAPLVRLAFPELSWS